MQDNVDAYELGFKLLEACIKGKLKEATALIDAGADVNFLGGNHRDDSPLTCAAGGGHTDIVRLLLQKGAKTEIQNGYAMTPLLCAALQGHPDAAAVLIEADANINYQDDMGRCALMIAAQAGKDKVVELLVGCGAALNLKTHAGKTLLDVATPSSRQIIQKATDNAKTKRSAQLRKLGYPKP